MYKNKKVVIGNCILTGIMKIKIKKDYGLRSHAMLLDNLDIKV